MIAGRTPRYSLELAFLKVLQVRGASRLVVRPMMTKTMMIIIQTMHRDVRVTIERQSTMEQSPPYADSPEDQPAPRLNIMSEERDSLPI